MARDKLVWGPDRLHPLYATEHFLIAGATGAGKTVLINMLMKSVLSRDAIARALVYDPKQEVIPFVFGMVEQPERVRILHPFDRRGCAWNLSFDLDGPVSARQFATILVPEKEPGAGRADSFFDEAVRDLLTGVILAFIQCAPERNAWTFRDVMLTMLYQPYLEFVLSLNWTRTQQPFPIVSRLKTSYLQGDVRTVQNIRASINAKLSIFEPVAAVWHQAAKCGQVFSLKEWLADGSHDVLVLGNDEASRAAIDAINQAIFKRASELLLARRELTRQEKLAGANLTWMFLDEAREARLDLSRLLTKGRSKGAAVVIGFQDIDGMRAAYGKEVAHEICGQCGSVGVLKLNSPSTADWAVELFGRRLMDTEGRNRTLGQSGELTRGQNISEQVRTYLQTADFLYLPKTSDRDGLRGFFKGSYRTAEEGFVPEHLPWQAGIQEFLPKKHTDSETDPRFSNHWPRPVEEHYLAPWDAKDWTRLGFDRIVSAPVPFDGLPDQQPVLEMKPKQLKNPRLRENASKNNAG